MRQITETFSARPGSFLHTRKLKNTCCRWIITYVYASEAEAEACSLIPQIEQLASDWHPLGIPSSLRLLHSTLS